MKKRIFTLFFLVTLIALVFATPVQAATLSITEPPGIPVVIGLAVLGAMVAGVLGWFGQRPREVWDWRKFLSTVIRGAISGVPAAFAVYSSNLGYPLGFYLILAAGAGGEITLKRLWDTALAEFQNRQAPTPPTT